MDIKITKSKLQGKFNIPPSKAVSHRAVICACLAKGKSIIRNVNMCDDVKTTINALREIVPIKIEGNTLFIEGGICKINKKQFDMYDSASTARFLLPILTYFSEEKIQLNLSKRLKERIGDECDKLYKNDYAFYCQKNTKIEAQKLFTKQHYKLSTKTTSQHITGLLLLSPFLGHKTTITTLGKNSTKYIDLTIDIMGVFGVRVERCKNNIFVMPNQKYKCVDFTVPADSSFAVNIATMNLLGSNIEITNTKFDTFNPDYDLYNAILNKKKIIKLDASTNPDSVFAISVLQSQTNKLSHIINTKRLKHKESDRESNICYLFECFHGKAPTKTNNSIKISNTSFSSGVVDSKGDHRIVFDAIILSTLVEEVVIKNAEATNKSYPGLFEDLKQNGLNYEIINNFKEYNLNNNVKIIYGNNALSKLPKQEKDTKRVLCVDKNIDNSIINSIIDKCDKNNTTIYKLNVEKESVKTLEEVNKLICFLLDKNISKTDSLIAIGGGTVLDFVSFVAMNYKRGIKHTFIPTTLLAQIDASIGGKNAININGVKNVFGGFYNPELIIIDPLLLSSISEKEKREGMAELIKIAAISDSKLFYDVYDSKPYQKLFEWEQKAIELKIDFIEKDPFDVNIRNALNFGHTYGHALELQENISHGEAVSKGMCLVSDNQELKELLQKYGLPTVGPSTERPKISEIYNDKKIKNNEINFVVVDEIGHYKFVKEKL